MKKNKSVLILFLVLAFIVGFAYYDSLILSSEGTGADMNISLGLDLAGGVSITYQVADEEFTEEELSDTIYKLQKRIETYSTEATVYKSGEDRIVVEIPGVTDANEILEDLGTPGSLEFYESDYETVFMTGDDIKDAQPGTYQDDYGNNQFCVDLVLKDGAAATFAQVTGDSIGQNLPIVYDGQVISNPTVQSKITGGSAQITGMESFEAADNLASMIRIGSLSLTLNELESQIVGASLGTEAISTALKAAAIGLAIIIVFMIAYYAMAGVAASIALLIYSVLTVAVLYWFEITLTLPGIAGIILGIGMAVDANVVIYGRIREEIAGGKSVFNSIRDGFGKATSAIVDGNVTTLIAAAVLAWKGSGTVKGFAYTLAIGIIISLITALFVTRYVMYSFYGVGLKDAKFYGKAKDREPVDFVKNRAIFYVIAVLCIASGFVGLGINKANTGLPLNLSLEFIGGSTVTVPFDRDYDLATIESEMVPLVTTITGDNEVSVQKVAGTNSVVFKTRMLTDEERILFDEIFENTYTVTDTIESQNISATISKEMTSDAVIAVVIAVILMMIYIAIRFSDLRFATAAVLALIHDVLLVFASYALLRISVGSTFIAVMLTILGYSINDTIVVFDRVRENIKGRAKLTKTELKNIANESVTQTIARSINTSVTTFVMVLLLYILGVASIKDFSLPLMVGIVAGLFSSVCISTNLWYEMKFHSKGVVEDKKTK